jgi:hypothetical protein
MDPYSLGRELMDASLSEQTRELEAAGLVREAREFRLRSASGRAHWLFRLVQWLLCRLYHGDALLSERLARYDLVQPALPGEQAGLLSADRCD